MREKILKQLLGDRRVSIIAQVTVVSTALLVVTVLLLSTITNFNALLQARAATKDSFTRIVDTAAMAVEASLDDLKEDVGAFGHSADLYMQRMSTEQLSAYLAESATHYGFKSLHFTDANGIAESGEDFSAYHFFKHAMAGDVHLHAPQVSSDGSYSEMWVAAPIYKDGLHKGEIVGTVIAVLDGKFLSDIIASVDVGETGDVYIIDSDGYTIADYEYSYVLSQENSWLYAEEDPSMLGYVEVEKSAADVGLASEVVSFEGVDHFLCVHYMEDYGWTLGAMATTNEYLARNMYSAFGSYALAFVITVLVAFIMFRVLRRVVSPLKDVASLVSEVALGNYTVSMEYIKNDEIGDIVAACMEMIASNGANINDVSRVLIAMSHGDFTQRPTGKYAGAFTALRDSTERISANMCDTFTHVSETASLVDSGSAQVDMGAANLAQGTAEQAAAIEQLSATMNDVAKKVRATAQNSEDATVLAERANEEMQKSSTQMGVLSDAMRNIENTSQDISKIIKSIEDIAFQTNILALNAAVEAARAGAAGKGFSVVADEVRSLAGKASEASKSTTTLIANAMGAIAEGSRAANVTGESINIAANHMSDVVSKVSEIYQATQEQAGAVDQITSGLEQISAVVQTNSATAEESAAASASMRQEASRLQVIMSKVKVRE